MAQAWQNMAGPSPSRCSDNLIPWPTSHSTRMSTSRRSAHGLWRRSRPSSSQSRLLISLQLASRPVNWPLMAVLLFWALALFFAVGLLSRTVNATVVTALAFAAFSVAGAMFLIIELGRPYTGLYKVSPAAIQETIEFLDK